MTLEPFGFTALSIEGNLAYEPSDIVVFSYILTNVGGYYNADTSVFVCPVSGIYVFTLSIVTPSYNSIAHIMLNDRRLVATKNHIDNHGHGSTFAVTECLINNKVWVQMQTNSIVTGTITDKYTAFSGFVSVIY